MKKKTKKLILELLDFWPMTIVVPAMLILILLGAGLGWGGQMKPKKTKKPKKVKGKIKSKKKVSGYYFDGKKSHTLYEDHWSMKR